MNTKLLNKLEPQDILPLISASAVLRKENHLRRILKYSKDNDLDFRKIYEVLLQTYLFAGFPSALQSLKIFREFFTPDFPIEKYNVNKFRTLGNTNCKKVYGNKFDKLIINVKSFSPHLSEWLIIEGYGKTLSRKKLGMKEREICIVSILTVLKYEEQLYSHIVGALRFGNSIASINKSIENLEFIGEKRKVDWGVKILQKAAKKSPSIFGES